MQCASCTFTGKRTVQQLLLIGLAQACQLAACGAQADERTVADIQYLGRGAGVAGLGQGLTVPVYDGALDGLAALRFLGKFSPPAFDVLTLRGGNDPCLLKEAAGAYSKAASDCGTQKGAPTKLFFKFHGSPPFVLPKSEQQCPS